jgi:hypothetical protein
LEAPKVPEMKRITSVGQAVDQPSSRPGSDVDGKALFTASCLNLDGELLRAGRL